MKLPRLASALIASLALAVFLRAQPAPDQFIPRYQSDATPYPLYAGKFGESPEWTPPRLQLLAENFDAFYGNPAFTAEQVNQLRAIKPTFQVVNYKGTWAIRDTATYEQSHRRDVLYYRAGNLKADISSAATTLEISDLLGVLLPSTAAPGVSVSGETMVGFRYVTWLLVGREFLRIESVNGATVIVTRGFAGTTAAVHAAGTPVLAPVYATPPTRTSLRYRHDPAVPLRWESLLAAAEADHASHSGGIWIDIITGNLSVNTMNGMPIPMNRRWDFRTQRGYSEADWDRAAEIGTTLMQEGFRANHGVYPIIWGNNLMHPVALDRASPGRLGLLLSTPEKPRPLDGFALENCYGGYGTGGNSGKEWSWKSFDEWQLTLRSLMFLAELKVSARPLMLDGGQDNNNFAAEPASFRHQVLLYGYCSYLLAVKIEPDDRIFSMIGFTPFVGPKSGAERRIELPPWFQWDIGRPSETRLSADFAGYRLPGTTVFQRRFANGLVLVNPADTGAATFTLAQPYFDPLAGATVTELTLPAKTARILFTPTSATKFSATFISR